jgi:hypothetical protein
MAIDEQMISRMPDDVSFFLPTTSTRAVYPLPSYPMKYDHQEKIFSSRSSSSPPPPLPLPPSPSFRLVCACVFFHTLFCFDVFVYDAGANEIGLTVSGDATQGSRRLSFFSTSSWCMWFFVVFFL